MIDVSSIDFIDLLEDLGLRNVHITSGGIEVNFSCHDSSHAHNDENASAYINSETGLFFCHACHLKGNVVDLVMSVQQVSRAAAECYLREKYGIEFDEPIGGSMIAETASRFSSKEVILEHVRPVESWLSAVRIDWIDHFNENREDYQEYILDRGLREHTLSEWDIGYDYFSDRLTIPVRDLDSNLFGIKGRDWSGKHPAKYLVLGDSPTQSARGNLQYGFQTYPITNVVFGLNRRRDYKQCVLVEGELDCIALWQMGIDRSIATGIARMSVQQAKLIIDECDEIIVFYDAGEAGALGTQQVVNLLEPYIRVRVATPLDVDPMDACRDGREAEIIAALAQAKSSISIGLALSSLLG
jgi:DNA primase